MNKALPKILIFMKQFKNVLQKTKETQFLNKIYIKFKLKNSKRCGEKGKLRIEII